MSKVQEAETGIELVLILGVIGFFLYHKGDISKAIDEFFKQVKAFFENPGHFIPDAAGATEGYLVGPAKFVGSGGPLTAQQALGISKVLGQEMNYNLSPDHFQIWFFNGDFYDNRDGLIRDLEGNVIAPAINSDGTVNDAAVHALVSANN